MDRSQQSERAAAGPPAAVGREIPLGEEDRAILAIECETVAGHTCKVIRLGGEQLGLEELRARVAERIGLAPALTRRLGGDQRSPCWTEDPDFDLTEHVLAADQSAPVGDDGLRAVVAQLFEQRLDRRRPLWRMYTIALEDGHTAIVWLIHHALADGTAAVRYARQLLWDDGPDASMSVAQAKAAHAADDARRRAHLAGFLRREYARGQQCSPFDGTIGTRREIALAAAPLSQLHDAARELDGATVNDAMLSIVAGALRHWLLIRHGELGEIRVRVPVSLHQEADALANHDSFFSLALPLGEADPVARLRAVHRATSERKRDGDALYREQLLHELSHVAPPLEHFVTRLEGSPRRFALSVSNVPGPRRPVSVLARPVRRLHSIAEIGEHHALRVAAVSVADELCFGLCADADLVDHLQLMAAGLEREAGELIVAAGRS